MYKPTFDIVKVKRLLARYGKPFTFQHIIKDEYGEDTDEVSEYQVNGVFHQSSAAITATENVQDGTISRRKPQPAILALATENLEIKHGDVVRYKNTNYQVVEVLNINSMDVAFDILLEVEDNGHGFGC